MMRSIIRANAEKDDNLMKKVDVNKLSEVQQMYIKKINQKADQSAFLAKKKKKKGRIIGLSLGAVVICIYAYTMYALKQEKFLDDFELPDPVDTTTKKKTH